MYKRSLPSLLLLILGVLLYALPPSYLSHWRLSLYSLYVTAAETLEPPRADSRPAATAASPQARQLEELRRRLLQQAGEIAALRQHLKELGSFRKAYRPVLRFQTARVIKFRRHDLTADTLILNRGRLDGLKTGWAVLQGQALVGTVARLGSRSALVMLLTAPASLAPARAGTSRKLAAVVGDGRGQARIIFYSSKVAVKKGETVKTSGLLGILPPGLIIGVVAEAPSPGSDPNTMEARLELQADLTTLEDLLVVHRSPE